VHVDYETQLRTVKASGHRYADLIRAHRHLPGRPDVLHRRHEADRR
jgi:hypothetical protein